MPLTAAKIRSAEARLRPYKIADGQGLFLHVAPTSTKTFRFAYRFGGKEKLLVFGRPGEISLADARDRRDDARQQLRQGRDPGARAAPAAANDDGGPTFAEVAERWIRHGADDWSPVHAGDVRRSLELHILPAIGAQPIATITTPAVLRLLQAVEANGAVETTRRLRQRLSGVFGRAIAEGLIEIDPAARVTKALRRPAEPVHHAAALTIADAREILAAVERAAGSETVKLASRFLAMTAMRWAAVRGTRWEEIEQLDGPAPTWRVPAARMKLARAKKTDAAHDHLVPLSPAAVAVLRTMQERHANLHASRADLHEGLIFPGRGVAPLGENAMLELYARAGLAGRHSPHGWRASWSTIMNEALPADRAAIDLALGHTPKIVDATGAERIDKVEGAYNRARHLDRRRYLFNLWGEQLTGTGPALEPLPA